MNSTRSAAYQAKACVRLASYRGAGGRLYSDAETAEQLGETVEWVRKTVVAASGHTR
jgi:hypothetical protein